MSITELQPQPVWHFFQALCDIPRPSKREQQVIDYCFDFAKQRALEIYQDKIGNVIIKKQATPGLEGLTPIVLQSHLDMVPQKNANTQHNFKEDPIKAYIDGDWVTAEGTTLGADNGIGVAAILAVLDSKDIDHGPIEALFTIDEEAGMTGASNLEPGLLNGKILFNLDTEDEGELYIGCAGGIDVNASWQIQWENLPENHATYEISVTGLKGGHSGVDIHEYRGNANKITNRILYQLMQDHDLRIGHFQGGSLRNAIPREAFTKVSMMATEFTAVSTKIQHLLNTLKDELELKEPDLSITIKETERFDRVLPRTLTTQVIAAIYGCPNGVIRMSDQLPGIVETSNNLAKISIKEDQLRVQCLVRSAVDSARADAVNHITAVFEALGAEVVAQNGYPGWKPNPESPILKNMKELYQSMYGKIPEVKVIHAGLECGLLGAAYPDWDMISFGPTIRGAHSPDERVHIASVGKFWEYFVQALKSVPAA